MNIFIYKEVENNLRQLIESSREKTFVEQRDASFDFCFLYFQTHRHLIKQNMELSCLHLWSYLASWGMLRNSKLLQCSMKSLSGVIEYLAKLDNTDWELDLGLNESLPDEGKMNRIIEIFQQLSGCIENILINNSKVGVTATPTLVTKIMLGTLGCIPAFDQYFTTTFREIYKEHCKFRSLNLEALKCIQGFYRGNREVIDKIKYQVIDFAGNPTKLTYPRAKLIDMYGFNRGVTNPKQYGGNRKSKIE